MPARLSMSCVPCDMDCLDKTVTKAWSGFALSTRDDLDMHQCCVPTWMRSYIV